MHNITSDHTPRCLTILGARPQFIKAAPLSDALRQMGWEELLVHTGQHYDSELSDIFFEELNLPPPDYHLNISGGGHGDMVGRMLIALEPLLKSAKPDVVLVYGDTNSTLAGALSAAQLNLPIAHVEAGLRSYRMEMPEEKNRRITDHLSTYLFCPTYSSIDNLKREGIVDHVYWVGDLMYDMALRVQTHQEILTRLNVEPLSYDVMTMHRAEICDHPERFKERLDWILKKRQVTHRPVVWPIHPRARFALSKLLGINIDDILLIDPVGYSEMATLIKYAHEVYTDSGGVQREAFFHQTLCTTLRDESEWLETVEAGWNRLWHQRNQEFPQERSLPSEFGNGDASRKIVEILTREVTGMMG